MKKIITFQHKDSAVFNYRFDRPLVNGLGAKKRRTILRKNEELQLGELANRLKKQGDIWVIKYIDNFDTLNILYSMRNLVGSKVIVDIDDNMWQIPIGNPMLDDIKKHTNRFIMLSESIKCADYVTVATEPLKEFLLKWNKNIEVLPNFVNPSEWKFKRKKHDKIRIGWVWSPTHIPDMPVIEKVLEKINKRSDVEIVIFGTEQDIFKFKTTNIKGVKYTEYPRVLTEEGIDISLGALADNDFNKCKSNIKWLESTMSGAVFIGSDVYPYSSSILNGKTGFICNTEKEWLKTINKLVDDKNLRENILKNAKDEVLKNYSNANKWINFYESIK